MELFSEKYTHHKKMKLYVEAMLTMPTRMGFSGRSLAFVEHQKTHATSDYNVPQNMSCSTVPRMDTSICIDSVCRNGSQPCGL